MAVNAVEAAGRLLISGEAGVGKSTLLEELATTLTSNGFHVMRAAATAGLRDYPLAALGHLIGDPGNLAGPALSGWADAQFSSRAPGTTGVVMIDDAHLLDDWSLHVLSQLGRADSARVVVAARSSSDWPQALSGLGRRPGARIDLQRLSFTETSELAANVLGFPLDTPSAKRIHAATDGLPLAVDELVRYALHRGSLTLRSGLFRWDVNSPVDQRLAALLGLRVNELSPTERDVVDLLALAEELPVHVIATVVDGADLPRLEEHRLVRATARPGWLTSGHPLLRDATLAMLVAVRRQELALRLVAALRRMPQKNPQLERRRVQISVDVGAEIEPDALLAVVRWARAHGLWVKLIDVMERAWHDSPSAFTGLAYGEALYWSRRMQEADAVFGAAIPFCVDDAERVQISIAQARTWEIGLGRDGQGTALRESQLERIADPALRLDLLAAQAERHLFDGRVEEILAIRDRVAPPPLDEAMSSARYRLTQATIGALTLGGQLEEAEREYALHLSLSVRHGERHPLALSVVEPWWVAGNLLGGRIELVRELLGSRYQTALTMDDGLSRPLWALPMCIDRWIAGDLVAAELYAREAMGVPDAVVSIRRMATHFLARVLTLRGGHPAALSLCESTAGDDYVGIVHGWSDGIAYTCRSRVDPVVRGDTSKFFESTRLLVESGQLVPAAFVLHDAACVKVAEAIVGQLNALARRVDAPTVHWMASHAGALLVQDVELLVATARQAGAAGYSCLAMLMCDDATKMAVGSQNHDVVAEVTALRRTYMTVVTGWPSASNLTSPLDGFELSGREREVALLAGRAHTDREIAEMLFISIRTVNAHLRAIYRKTGLVGRRALRDVLSDAR